MTEALPREAVLAALATVDDPELGVNIVDLGLVRRLECGPERIDVRLMMTTPTCPLGALLQENAKVAIEAVAGGDIDVDVRLDRDAVWSPELATPAVRARFEQPASGLGALLRLGLDRLRRL